MLYIVQCTENHTPNVSYYTIYKNVKFVNKNSTFYTENKIIQFHSICTFL